VPVDVGERCAAVGEEVANLGSDEFLVRGGDLPSGGARVGVREHLEGASAVVSHDLALRDYEPLARSPASVVIEATVGRQVERGHAV
jgi:hypothetical protein